MCFSIYEPLSLAKFFTMRTTLLVILCGYMLSGFAQDTVNVEGVTISENRIELPFSESSRVVDVITATDIAASAAQSVPELLQELSGIDVRQRGAHGVQGDPGYQRLRI